MFYLENAFDDKSFIPEILRVIRRLNMKEQWTDMSLHHLTLRTLRSALDGNPRGQNHFRSIGGLEVLLDGFGFLSVDSLIASDQSSSDERCPGLQISACFTVLAHFFFLLFLFLLIDIVIRQQASPVVSD